MKPTMAQHYYLADPASGDILGPYDILTLARWVRRGRLAREQILKHSPFDEGDLAIRFPEIAALFTEAESEISVENDYTPVMRPSFKLLIGDAWEHFKQNQSLAVLTGMFLIVGALGVLLLTTMMPNLASAIIGSIWLQFLLTVYTALMLRWSRMQPATPSYFQRIFMRNGSRLFLISLLLAIVMGIAPLLLGARLGMLVGMAAIIPGVLLYSYFMFLPLIVLDHDMSLGRALALNAAKMKKVGIDGYTIVFALVLINVLLPVLPMTLPVTFLALCAFYDRNYNDAT